MHLLRVGDVNVHEIKWRSTQGFNRADQGFFVARSESVPSYEDFTTSWTSMLRKYVLTTLDVRKAAIPDGLSAAVLKMVGPAISCSLTTLFNASLESGQFPHKWKRVNVTPVSKSGDNQLVKNYRSISVLPIIAKTF